MKIISWNICGINSANEEDFLDDIFKEDPDVLCIQEIKTSMIPEVEGYVSCSNPYCDKPNLYGTAIYTKIKAIDVQTGFEDEKDECIKQLNDEGRVIKMEFEDFNLFNVYAPSGARTKDKSESIRRLKRKYRFFDELTEYVLKSDKPSIICGDFNRISKEIDAKNPKNIKGKSGFLKKEQEWFEEILTEYVDAFRKFNQEGDNFTWWPNRKGFRKENKGYRFDYFLVSNDFEDKITNSYILKDQCGSDHAPIVLELDLNKN